MTRAGGFVALITASVLFGAVSATAETAAEPNVVWDAASFTAESGVQTTISGSLTAAEENAQLVVEKLDDGWSAVESQVEGSRFSATVAGEAATYRAVLTSGETIVSSEVLVVTQAARSDLTLVMPKSAKDRSKVTAKVNWSRTADGAPLTGQVALVFRRKGLETWKALPPIDVTDGYGEVVLAPRNDGSFRVRWAGSADVLPVESRSATFNNVPTTKLRVRVGHYNLPGADKLKRARTRAVKAARSIKAADLDVVTFNELVGPGHNSTANPPSSFARAVLEALGPKWRIVTPTMSYNENYIAYRPDRVELIAHYPDRVVPGVGSGDKRKQTARHVTPALFKDRGSNQPMLVVATHLVHNFRSGARKQAYSVGRHASALSSGYPVVVAGDMNTSEHLRGLRQQGLKDARRTARQRTNASYSTYVKYSKTKPSKDASWIIDQIYVPNKWTVTRWTTVLGTKNGSFTQPRASDHLLVWSSLVGPRP